MKKEIEKPVISAIVPLFNEEKTIEGVVIALLNNPLINEVICVNDGSTDKSLEILTKLKNKINLINLTQNQGKGFALAEGIKIAKGEIVTFIDADFINLSDQYINTLLEPILKHGFRAVLGYCDTGSIENVFANLTGQRAYYKNDLLPHLEKIAKTRFGVEVFLNDLFTAKETKKVPLKNLRGLYKYEKRNSKNTVKEYIMEAVEIAKEIGNKEILPPKDYQIIEHLVKVTNFKEYMDKVKGISNKPVRHFLEKYILSYINIFQKK